ncbi:hypothetical protein SCHPADRAFT_999406 [Schizopora paradoxa]|uniref:Protein kinase domain-containing protein n=1 Tax=Schizopora paradoxa TaxID=27342 RepID=A0A0H2RFK5_9AGAM|nr:hypothetical protein SCHPADRAFT_999406 [Schizopora paradoxa]
MMAERRNERPASLVDTVFPDAILDFTSKEIEEILQINTLWRDGEWVSWPRKNATISEQEMVNFISLIRNEVKTRFASNSNPRYCSSMFREYPVPDPQCETTFKPGIVFTRNPFQEEERDTVDWSDIEMVLEMVSPEMLDKGISRCSRYCERMFDRWPCPRFVPAAVIAGSHIILLIFDRSGMASSEKISVHDNPQKFLRLIIGFLFVSLEHLGFEMTIVVDEDGSHYIKAGDVEYQVSSIYREPGIEGRGTVCYHGVSQEDQSDVVIKDSWVDVCNEQTEIDILNQLNERDEKELCTPDGVRVIPQIVSHEILKTRRPGIAPGEWVDLEATTALFRHHLVEWDGDSPKWTWTSSDKSRKSENVIRKFCRIVMKPFGQKLDTFTSKKVLIRAFGDIVHAIRILNESGIIHRDISSRNILLHKHKGELRGLLIDYDFAVCVKRASSTTLDERVGSPPFMAIDRLPDPPMHPHSYFHDVESLFYVMCWMFTFYSGPRSNQRGIRRSELSEMVVAKWNVDGASGMSLFVAKWKAMHEHFFDKLLNQFDPYFSDYVQECVEAIREIIFKCRGNLRGSRFHEKKAELDRRLETASFEEKERILDEYNVLPISMRHPQAVFQTFLGVLDETVSKLPKEADEEEAGKEAGVDSSREENQPDKDVRAITNDEASKDVKIEDVLSQRAPSGSKSASTKNVPLIASSLPKKRKFTEHSGTCCSPKHLKLSEISEAHSCGGVDNERSRSTDSNATPVQKELLRMADGTTCTVTVMVQGD